MLLAAGVDINAKDVVGAVGVSIMPAAHLSASLILSVIRWG